MTYRGYFAILMALDDNRTADALLTAQTVLEDAGDPDVALLQLALIANTLHSVAPSMPLRLIATMTESDLDPDSITTGMIRAEMLDVLEEMFAADGQVSETARQILARYEMRPGSAAAVEELCGVANFVLMDLACRMPVGVDSAALIRESLAATRSTVTKSF